MVYHRENEVTYKNTQNNLMMNQLCQQQDTPIIETRNNMLSPSIPSPPSSRPAHSAKMPPNYSLSGTFGLDSTKHKKESEKMSIDLFTRNAEDKVTNNSGDSIHSENSLFLQVENKLEELLDKNIPSTSFANDQVVTKNELKPIIPTKKINNKKRKKIKKNPPTPKKSKPAVKSANKKFTGPFIRLNGDNIENPNSFVIINKNIPNNDSSEGHNINTKMFAPGLCNISKKPDIGDFVSSGNHCVFCLRGHYVRDLGYGSPQDLFGPYYISLPKVVKTNDTPKQKKSNLKSNDNDNDTLEILIEVWAHEKCLVWSSGVFMIGATIFGLEDSVKIAKETVCVYCGVNGASIGCAAHHCKSSTHYSCAIDAGWLLDNETFITSCNIHRNCRLGI